MVLGKQNYCISHNQIVKFCKEVFLFLFHTTFSDKTLLSPGRSSAFIRDKNWLTTFDPVVTKSQQS